PSVSNPGPRLAEVAGTRTVTAFGGIAVSLSALQQRPNWSALVCAVAGQRVVGLHDRGVGGEAEGGTEVAGDDVAGDLAGGAVDVRDADAEVLGDLVLEHQQAGALGEDAAAEDRPAQRLRAAHGALRDLSGGRT